MNIRAVRSKWYEDRAALLLATTAQTSRHSRQLSLGLHIGAELAAV